MIDPEQNIGGKPTQQTKDNMAQIDHDVLTRLTVLMETMLTRMTTIEQAIKDAVVAQAVALQNLDTKVTNNHSGLDGRVRILEDQATKYLPTYVQKVDTLVSDVETLKTNKAETLAGWKVIIWILGSMAGFSSFLWIVSNIIFALLHR